MFNKSNPVIYQTADGVLRASYAKLRPKRSKVFRNFPNTPKTKQIRFNRVSCRKKNLIVFPYKTDRSSP